MAARKGKSLEKLVKFLEETMASPNALIESPKFLKDRITGKPREHDVVITTKEGHHKIIIAIECRDRKRPVGVPDIEAFDRKCEDTGIHKKVIVSSTGFQKTALEKAHSCEIKCLGLDEVSGFSWLKTQFLEGYRQRLWQSNWEIDLVQFDPQFGREGFQLVYEDESEVLKSALDQTLLSFVNTPEWHQCSPSGDFCVELNIKTREKLFMKEISTGKLAEVHSLGVQAHFSLEENFSNFELRQYKDYKDGSILSSMAIAEMDFGGLKGQMVITNNPHEGGTIYFVPNGNESIKKRV